jgi:hypothetical protein
MCTIAVGISVRIPSSNFFLRRSTMWTRIPRVLELLLAQVDDVDPDSPRGTFPVDPVHPADLVVLGEAPREQSSLASRDSGDEDLFHHDSKGLRDQLTP